LVILLIQHQSRASIQDPQKPKTTAMYRADTNTPLSNGNAPTVGLGWSYLDAPMSQLM